MGFGIDPIAILWHAGWPLVVCPGCSAQMRPTEKRRITPLDEMVMVTYVCEQCQFETVRTLKGD
jgi:C4-type Zn-finger protein